MKSKIKNSDEFEKLLIALTEEIGLANVYFKLYQDIRSAIIDYQHEFNESNTFWFLTLSSLLDTALVRLCRIYDIDPRVNSLPNILIAIKQNLDFFDEKNFKVRLKDNPFVDSLAKFSRKPDPKQLDSDIKFANKDTNSSVNNLFRWRNNIVAHKSSNYIIKELNYPVDYPLSINDIENLLKKSMSIINNYSSLFHASSYSPQIVGHDDFKYVLTSIREKLTRHKEKIEEELKTYDIESDK